MILVAFGPCSKDAPSPAPEARKPTAPPVDWPDPNRKAAGLFDTANLDVQVHEGGTSITVSAPPGTFVANIGKPNELSVRVGVTDKVKEISSLVGVNNQTPEFKGEILQKTLSPTETGELLPATLSLPSPGPFLMLWIAHENKPTEVFKVPSENTTLTAAGYAVLGHDYRLTPAVQCPYREPFIKVTEEGGNSSPKLHIFEDTATVFYKKADNILFRKSCTLSNQTCLDPVNVGEVGDGPVHLESNGRFYVAFGDRSGVSGDQIWALTHNVDRVQNLGLGSEPSAIVLTDNRNFTGTAILAVTKFSDGKYFTRHEYTSTYGWKSFKSLSADSFTAPKLTAHFLSSAYLVIYSVRNLDKIARILYRLSDPVLTALTDPFTNTKVAPRSVSKFSDSKSFLVGTEASFGNHKVAAGIFDSSGGTGNIYTDMQGPSSSPNNTNSLQSVDGTFPVSVSAPSLAATVFTLPVGSLRFWPFIENEAGLPKTYGLAGLVASNNSHSGATDNKLTAIAAPESFIDGEGRSVSHLVLTLSEEKNPSVCQELLYEDRNFNPSPDVVVSDSTAYVTFGDFTGRIFITKYP